MEYSIEDLMKAVEIEASNREKTAAHNGQMSDGGASTLRLQLKYYKMGMETEYPKEWEKYGKHIDPEYPQYLRLKKKFGSME